MLPTVPDLPSAGYDIGLLDDVGGCGNVISVSLSKTSRNGLRETGRLLKFGLCGEGRLWSDAGEAARLRKGLFDERFGLRDGEGPRSAEDETRSVSERRSARKRSPETDAAKNIPEQKAGGQERVRSASAYGGRKSGFLYSPGAEDWTADMVSQLICTPAAKHNVDDDAVNIRGDSVAIEGSVESNGVVVTRLSPGSTVKGKADVRYEPDDRAGQAEGPNCF